jgi:hypothetical protein
MRAFVRSGASGVLLKSKAPYTSWLADILGLQREKHSIFNLSSTCGRNSSQSWRGQSWSTVARGAMKCSLKVAIACSVALALWLCSGTRWMLIFSDQIYLSTAVENLLSITFYAGWYPWVRSTSMTSLNAVIIALLVHVGMAWTMMALRL